MIFLLRMTVPLILTPVKMMKRLTCQVTFVERKASVDYNNYLGRANNCLEDYLFREDRSSHLELCGVGCVQEQIFGYMFVLSLKIPLCIIWSE